MATTETSIDQTDNIEFIEQLMQERFAPGNGDPRSAAYKHGTRSVFSHRIIGGRIGALPYLIGTAEADAYFSGQQDGRTHLAAHLAESAQAAKAALVVPA